MNKNKQAMKAMRSKTMRSKERGFVLVTALLLLMVMTLIGMTLSYKITTTLKAAGLNRADMAKFYGAEGGIIHTAVYIQQYEDVFPPASVVNTDTYEVDVKDIGSTTRYRKGYGGLSSGSSVMVNSVSPPRPNDTTEIEAVLFLASKETGYGNEGY